MARMIVVERIDPGLPGRQDEARRRLLPDLVRRLGGRFTVLVRKAARLARDHRQRRELARLTDQTLADLGLVRSDIDGALDRPFWHAVDYGELERRRRARRDTA